MKIAFVIIAIIFLAFALLQINDPDPVIWVTIYGYVVLVYCLALADLKHKALIYIGLAGYFVGVIKMSPDFFDWIRRGTPSITGSMKATTPYIELTREFFGLVLCLLAMIFLLFPLKK